MESKPTNLVFQTFLMTFAQHMNKRGWSGNNYNSNYYSRNKWFRPTLTKANINFNPILAAMRFKKFVFWKEHRYDCNLSLNKKWSIDEATLTKIVSTFAGQIDYDALKGINTISVSTDILKKITLATGDLEFYFSFANKRYGSTYEFPTLVEVEKIVKKLAELKLKVNGQSQYGFHRLINGLTSEISKVTNIDPYVKLYKQLKTVKGYTTSTRAVLVCVLVKSGIKDPKSIEKLKLLLKKEKSKRVWSDFKQSILNEYFPTSHNSYDHSKREYTKVLQKGKVKELIDFIADVDGTPELSYYYRGNGIKNMKEMLEKGTIKEKEQKNAPDSNPPIR